MDVGLPTSHDGSPKILSSAPQMEKLGIRELLLVHLVVSEVVVSAVLVCKDKCMQHPIYYVSKTLLDAKTRYSHLEKLALALVTTARKLRPYFQCHPICVVSTFPLQSI